MNKDKIRKALERIIRLPENTTPFMQETLACGIAREALSELDTDDWIKVTPETMPKDNELVIIFSKHGREMVVYNGHNNCWDDMDGDDYYRDIEWASHWMPPPSNPKE